MSNSGIYCYIDKETDDIVYVGKSLNIVRRLQRHKSRNAYNEQVINRVIQDNPERYYSHIIMESTFTNDELNDLEIFFISEINPKFNFTEGGDGGSTETGWHHSEEARANMSKNHADVSGENNPMWGKTHSLEVRQRISEKNKGCVVPKERRESISKSLSEVKSSTGYYRVSKITADRVKQGFYYEYRYRDEDNKQHTISSVDINKLEDKVKDKGLEWIKFEED